MNKLTLEEVEALCTRADARIDMSTYVKMSQKARFIDVEHGAFWARPCNFKRGDGHPNRRYLKTSKKQRLSLDEINLRLRALEEPIEIVGPYVNYHHVTTFMDREFGEFSATLNSVLVDLVGHPDRTIAKRQQRYESRTGYTSPLRNPEVLNRMRATMVERYGVRHALQHAPSAIKAARSSNKSKILFHWKTKEELVCVGSYEYSTVEFLNRNRIIFTWQPGPFMLQDGSSYTPDLYLPESNVYVEIKGYMRPDALTKCNLFKDLVERYEIWDEVVLKQMGILRGRAC